METKLSLANGLSLSAITTLFDWFFDEVSAGNCCHELSLIHEIKQAFSNLLTPENFCAANITFEVATDYHHKIAHLEFLAEYRSIMDAYLIEVDL